jgi:hypothetical protein
MHHHDVGDTQEGSDVRAYEQIASGVELLCCGFDLMIQLSHGSIDTSI